MITHLLHLSLHGELRRGTSTGPHTINGKAAGNLLAAGLAEVAHRQRRANKPAGRYDLEWIRLSDYGRRRLEWHLERKL